MTKKTVFVGMSGGVDSSVSAALLQKQGYNVVGVFIRTWHPDFIECNEEEERLDAMRVCAHLDIPFLTFDFEDVYKKEVADYMIAEYGRGRTPNPDVMCNKYVKFGAFLKKAISMGADYVATGHYVKSEKILNNSIDGRFHPKGGGMSKNYLDFFHLQKGIDPSKDQSYFLWTLKQEQLSKILFPIGHLEKIEVRKLAQKFKLPVANKKDSQGICFLGKVDLKDFLKHYIKEKKGKVVLAPQKAGNEEGEVIGMHDGVVFLTLGARHGFTITKKGPNDGPYYVVGKDLKKNILYVSQKQNSKNYNRGRFHLKGGGMRSNFLNSVFVIKNVNWISDIPKESKDYTAQIRYHGEFLLCKINFANSLVQVVFQTPILVASGQSIVFYDKDVCLGGGVVK